MHRELRIFYGVSKNCFAFGVMLEETWYTSWFDTWCISHPQVLSIQIWKRVDLKLVLVHSSVWSSSCISTEYPFSIIAHIIFVGVAIGRTDSTREVFSIGLRWEFLDSFGFCVVVTKILLLHSSPFEFFLFNLSTYLMCVLSWKLIWAWKSLHWEK